MCGVVVTAAEVLEAEEDESSEEALVMAAREVFGNAFECDDESDGLEKKP